MDADLSHDPKYIPKMIEKQRLTKADIVLGSRYVKEGGVDGWPLRRIITSRTANYLTNLLLGLKVSDFTNSFRIYKREIFEEILPLVDCPGFGFQMEIMIHALRLKFKVEEIPIVFIDRLFGESKFGLGEIQVFV
jgi:dolichol-phosphate mannosyltransferase